VKFDTTERRFLLASQLIAAAALIYCIRQQMLINEVVKNLRPRNFVVVEIECGKRKSDIVILDDHNKMVHVEGLHRQCSELNSGDSVLLYYSKYRGAFFWRGLLFRG
jgi:hypothetical protein